MKKYIVTALVLTLIAGVCAALIASINLLTAPMIEKNNAEKKAALCQEIFEAFDLAKSIVLEKDQYASAYIQEVIEVNDANDTPLGYLFTLSGSNAYGKIELLVGIDLEIRLAGVRFITNGQSFSNETATHLNTQYKDDMTIEDILAIDLTNSDVTAGATYASKLIRELVTTAFDVALDLEGGSK